MRKIYLAQYYEIDLPKEYESKSKEELLNDLNSMYDIRGKDFIEESLASSHGYMGTQLLEIDEEDVYLDNNKVNSSGSPIILNGQPLEEED